MKKLVLISCAIAISFILQGQTNYYVSKTGDNSDDGLSIGTAWKTIQYAAGHVIPASTVNILAGTYNEFVDSFVSGTPGNPITFKNYQNGKVILSGIGFTVKYSYLIYLSGKSNIVIDGLILENLTAQSCDAIQVVCEVDDKVENISLKNLIIRNIGFTKDTSYIPDTTDNAHGIEVYGKGITQAHAIKNIIIENCEVYNNITGYSENVTLNGNVDGFTITGNTVHDNTNIGIEIAGNYPTSSNPILNHARNGIVYNNTTYKNISKKAVSSGIYCDGCQNTIIERNISYNNGVGITAGCEEAGTADNVIIRENLVFNNSFTGIEIGGYHNTKIGIVQNSSVHNNTCYYNNPGNQDGQLVIYRTSSCKIFQNIFYSKGDLLFYVDKKIPQTYTMDFNDFYTTTGNIADAEVDFHGNIISYSVFKNTTKKDSNSIFSDPEFKNTTLALPDLHLQKTSPCRDSGDHNYLTEPGELDFDGEVRANGIVDIGADEYYTPTLINESDFSDDEWKLYPNPAFTIIHIESKNSSEKQYVQIRNVIGQLIKEVPFIESTQLDISELMNGIYFVSMKGQFDKVYKLIKI